MTTTQESIEQTAAELGLTMKVEFVPLSKSRNAAEKSPTLNWKVTLEKNGRPFLTTDYSAGGAFCPSYQASVKALGNKNSVMRDGYIRKECETGREVRLMHNTDTHFSGKQLLPSFADVLHSLTSDSDVIDYGSFEEWADNLGYDKDSRKAEGIYRACLDIALKLRNALGEQGFSVLRQAVSEY